MAVSTRARNLFVISLIVSLVAAACGGGSTPEPATAESSDSEEHQKSGDSNDDEKSSASAADSKEVPVAKRPACDDGTCTLCGDAQCPTGWYCDESAKGGPACGWLPECAKKPTCACVKKVFPGGCEERNGGLYVKQ
jgi:hypothetical protein